MGIDYGTKRIGIAMAESGSTLAFPKAVIANNGSAKLVAKLCELITDNQVETVVIGESLNLDGRDNTIMKEINHLTKLLKSSLPQIDIYLEPEHYSSFQAERYQGKHDQVDASAAAIILQAWLDRRNYNPSQINGL